jgi:hypothetical protein
MAQLTGWARPVRVWIGVSLLLIISLVVSPGALAEHKSFYGGNYYMFTVPYFDGPLYKMNAYAYSAYAEDGIFVTSRGYNNGGGWHETGRSNCSVAPYDASRACEPYNFAYDSTESPDSTQRYAATRHQFYWSSGSFDWYTSTDGNHSSFNCVYYAGC